MLSVALVGCAHIHTPGFVKTLRQRGQQVRVKLVWDHDPARAAANAAELGAQAVGEVSNVWADRDVSAVIVCSETNRHEPLVLAAAAAGKHMFVEKPLGMGARDSLAMADAIERAGVTFQTGYVNRSWPPVRFLREHVQKGTFGKITRARVSVCHQGALGGWFDTQWRWMADVKQAGVGAFGDLGTHGLDILMWLFGPVAAVTATLDPGTARYPDCDETGEAIIRFKSGVIATLAAAWDDVANPVSYLISGTEAHASIINDELYFKCPALKHDGAQPIAYSDCPKGLPHAFDLFLDALQSKEVPLVTPREAADRCVVMEAIHRAARMQTWVELP